QHPDLKVDFIMAHPPFNLKAWRAYNELIDDPRWAGYEVRPTGIRWAGQNRPGVIPWLWGINGVMSVLGSALATLFAIHIGFRLTLLLAALVYVAAGWLFMAELGVKWRGETAVSAAKTPQTSV
ncbi:MAG: hypothetical protein KDE56_10930, partial [Anaerolineales bacterium]|nr:hypothetical protein [Anaerolineales bacterium]